MVEMPIPSPNTGKLPHRVEIALEWLAAGGLPEDVTLSRALQMLLQAVEDFSAVQDPLAVERDPAIFVMRYFINPLLPEAGQLKNLSLDTLWTCFNMMRDSFIISTGSTWVIQFAFTLNSQPLRRSDVFLADAQAVSDWVEQNIFVIRQQYPNVGDRLGILEKLDVAIPLYLGKMIDGSFFFARKLT
jgi:hypothetical protein